MIIVFFIDFGSGTIRRFGQVQVYKKYRTENNDGKECKTAPEGGCLSHGEQCTNNRRPEPIGKGR